MVQRIPRRILREITSKEFSRISDHDRDEMAIPSYLHGNLLIRWLMWKRYERIAALANCTKEMTVLEFGCGIGVFLPELDKSAGKVFAIGLFPEYAQILSQKFGLETSFIEDISEIPDNSLDIIVAADVLEHIDEGEQDNILITFSQKLNGGGRLIVSGPTESFVYRIGRIVAGFAGKGDYHHTNIDRLIENIQKHFILEKINYLPFKIPPYLFKVCKFQKR